MEPLLLLTPLSGGIIGPQGRSATWPMSHPLGWGPSNHQTRSVSRVNVIHRHLMLNSLIHSGWTLVAPDTCLSLQRCSKRSCTYNLVLLSVPFLALLLENFTLAWITVLEKAKHIMLSVSGCLRDLQDSVFNIKIRLHVALRIEGSHKCPFLDLSIRIF